MIKCLKEGSYAATCAFKTLGYAVNNHWYDIIPHNFSLLFLQYVNMLVLKGCVLSTSGWRRTEVCVSSIYGAISF